MDKQSDHRKNAKPGSMIGMGIGLGAGVDEIRLYGGGEPSRGRNMTKRL